MEKIQTLNSEKNIFVLGLKHTRAYVLHCLYEKYLADRFSSETSASPDEEK